MAGDERGTDDSGEPLIEEARSSWRALGAIERPFGGISGRGASSSVFVKLSDAIVDFVPQASGTCVSAMARGSCSISGIHTTGCFEGPLAAGRAHVSLRTGGVQPPS